MKDLKVQAVCGFGVGSSTLLKMKLDQAFKKNGIVASVFAGDVATASSVECDVIFTSLELAETLNKRAKVPVVVIHSFVDKIEIETKALAFVESLK
ncbi:MAG: PTS sugar transporter subunit IIB [Erysipelothrix sp.]|jgi:PTS system ascorbate-specific IIB component|nr:PTS sugar transporter subunit IIB [Erysipelothrix sp.]